MARYTTFRYCLDPTVEQREALQRHYGAARFAFNESLRMVKTKLNQRRMNPDLNVAWTKFELINQFNRWKKFADAGRNLVVDTAGNVEILVTVLPWRNQVCQQVFEEGAADCAKALKGWSDSRSGRRRGRRVRFPRFKKKAGTIPSFRMRNKRSGTGGPLIRLGEAQPRSVTMPGIGTIRVRDDTRHCGGSLLSHAGEFCSPP